MRGCVGQCMQCAAVFVCFMTSVVIYIVLVGDIIVFMC